MSERSSEVRVPPLKKGWMEKQSRKGVVRNWKKRFFVLNQGKIFYYVDESLQPPYGENLKGEMNLVNTELMEEKSNDKQIFIVSFNGENNILMEAESSEDAKQWAKAIRMHISYANSATEKSVRSAPAAAAPVSTAAPTSSPSSPAPARRASAAESAPAAPAAVTATAPASAPVPPPRPAALVPPTVSATAAAESKPAPAGEKEKALSAGESLNKLVDLLTRLSMDSEFRNKTISTLVPSLQSAATSALENLQEGQPGDRGEKLLGLAALLFVIIFIGFVPRLLWVVNLLLKILAALMIAAGLAMVMSAAIELKENMSLVLTPSPNNTLVRTGLFAFVRHPMYGGIVLFAFGRAIISDRAYQVLLAVALAIVLNIAAEKEEDLLEKKHPKEYPLYAANRKVLVPFLY